MTALTSRPPGGGMTEVVHVAGQEVRQQWKQTPLLPFGRDRIPIFPLSAEYA